MPVTAHAVRDAVRWFSNPAGLREPIVKLISANQSEPAHMQLFALAGALTCTCDAIGIDPHELISRLRRARADIAGPYSNQWDAMEAYAKGELTDAN